MLNNYLKIARRNLWKHKFYTALNIFGLSLGIAGGLVLFQFISYHLSFDGYHRKAGQLYRVVTDLHMDDGSQINEQGAPFPLTAALQNQQPAVADQSVLLKMRIGTVSVPDGDRAKLFTEHDNIVFADPHYFNLFDYTWEEGNTATALSTPFSAVITRTLADKYFGQQDPLGKIIRLDNKALTITGVLAALPATTDLTANLFVSQSTFKSFYPDMYRDLNNSWGVINSTTQAFIWLPDANAVSKIDAAMLRMRSAYFDPDVANVYHFHLQPLSDMHFNGLYGGTMQRSLLLTLAVVGLFLVIIACFNFINLSTAQSVKRAKEIGTRKVLGSAPGAIFWQFITETAYVTIFAAVLAFAWIMLMLPVLNDWLQIRLQFNFLHDHLLLMGLTSLLVFIILAGGFYPAFIMSRFKPVDAFKKQVSGGTKTATYRKALIVLQNAVVQVLIICTLIVTLQVRHLKTKDLGFNKNAVLMVNIPAANKHTVTSLGDALRNIPGVSAVSFCMQPPSSETYTGGSVRYDQRAWEKYASREITGDDHYLQTFQLTLVAGSNLQANDTSRQYLINETLLHKLGIKDPQAAIGHLLEGGYNRPGTIAGVVKDFNVHSLYIPVEPVFITTSLNRYRNVAIKLNTSDLSAAKQQIKTAWEAAYPDKVFEYHFLNEQIDAFYHKEDLLNKLINVTATIAIIISCLGLLGLISFFTIQRTKEIGIRKVLGANIGSIVYLLSKEFLQLVIIAMLIATPVAWYYMHKWLLDYAYRIQISGWVFVFTALVSITLAIITIAYQSIRAAMANPVDSLKGE